MGRIKLIVKDGNANLYLSGDLVTTTSSKGVVEKANDGNYYRTTFEVIDGVPTAVISSSLGTSV